ncbi:MAG: thiamine phosphate synthase [Gemmatimonadota bacterium]
MRPLPRVLAFTDQRIAALDDFGIRAAAIAAAGSAAALVARLPGGTADALAALARRCVALATPPEAGVLVTGRADIAAATGAEGVILRRDDLDIEAARASFGGRPAPWTLRSVHSLREAEQAADEGATGVVFGPIWPTASHPEAEGVGLAQLERIAALGVPTFAIGGVTANRAVEARDAGAWGVAAIAALWNGEDCYESARALLSPWHSTEEGAR